MIVTARKLLEVTVLLPSIKISRHALWLLLGLSLITSAGGRTAAHATDAVQAPAGSAPLASCQDAAFCTVRSGAPVWACPEASALALPTADAKGGAGCIAAEAGNTGAVVPGASGIGPIAILFGGGTGDQPRLFVARADLDAVVAIPSRPTPFDRGWCKPGDTCVTSAPALFCPDRATEERLLALPAGEASRTEVLMEAGCRRLLRGNPLTPAELPTPGDPARLVPVTHPVLKKGWASADAFGAVALSAPSRQRDRRAAFPRELAGRWFDDRRACRDPGRNGEDYEKHAVMEISPEERTGNREFEFSERAKAVRRVGPGSWQIDGSHIVDGLDPPEISSTATYTLTREGLTLTREGTASKWIRCR